MPVRLLPWELDNTMTLLFGGRDSLDSSQSRAIRRTYLKMPIPKRIKNPIPWPERDSRSVRRWWPAKLRAIIPLRWLRSNKFPALLRRYVCQIPGATRMEEFIKVFPREDHEALGLYQRDEQLDDAKYGRYPMERPTRLIWAYSEFPFYGKRLRELRLQ